MGITVTVLKRSGEPEQRTLMAAFGELVDGPFEPVESAPAMAIIWGPNVGGQQLPVAVCAAWSEEHERWLPVVRTGEVGPMFSGRFIFTSDSRFASALREHTGRDFGAAPVPMHDRWETPKNYASLCR